MYIWFRRVVGLRGGIWWLDWVGMGVGGGVAKGDGRREGGCGFVFSGE